MKIKKAITILLFLITGFLSAQTPKQADSLFLLARKHADIGDSMNLKQALVLAKKTYDFSKEINYKKGIGNSAFLISAINFNMGNDEEVIAYSSIVKEFTDQSDSFQRIENLRIRAMSLINLGYAEKAREELRNALLIVPKIEHPYDQKYVSGTIYDALILYFYPKHDRQSKDSLLYYSKKAYKNYDQLQKVRPDYRNIENSLSLASVNLGSSYLNLNKDLDSVAFYLQRGLSLSKKNGHAFVECLSYQHLGEMYFLQQQFEKSRDSYLQGLTLIKKVNDPGVTRDLYKGISETYDALKDDSKAKEYLAKYVKLNDSITTAEKKAIKLPIEQILNENEKAFSISRFWYLSIIVLSSLLLVLFAYLSYLFFKKFRSEKMSKEEKEILLAEKKKEIEKASHSTNENLNEIIQLAINDNPVFYIRFQEFHAEFCDKLKLRAPSLVLSELKCCALLKLNFSTKEIARFTNSTVRAVEQKKYRIRKKLAIPSDEDMNIWMMNL